MNRILIIGATSAIAEAVAREFAQQGSALFLVARREQPLRTIADDLGVRGASKVGYAVMDVNHLDQHVATLSKATDFLGGLDAALIAHGTLSDQAACQQSVDRLLQEFQTNALSVMALSTLLASQFEKQRNGMLAVISSVAGDRGRGSNYVYGAAKAAVSAFLSGLRQRLLPLGVHVLTIKPGFVDTPMTATFKKGALWATPAQVGAAIHRAMLSRKPVLYTPWFWWGIMTIIKSIPERVFMRLKGL